MSNRKNLCANSTRNLAKVKKTKDPNAPSRPLSAYNLFYRERCKTLRDGELKMQDYVKIISKEWNNLAGEIKKQYFAQADSEKEHYRKLWADYQKTDSYKRHLKKIEKLSKGIGNKSIGAKRFNFHSKYGKDDKESLGWHIDIFTPSFLEHNKSREVLCKQLQRQAATLEDEKSLLSAHLANMRFSVQNLDSQSQGVEPGCSLLETHLSIIFDRLVKCLKHLSLPADLGEDFILRPDNVITLLRKVHKYQLEKSNKEFTRKVRTQIEKNLIFRENSTRQK